MSSMCNPANMEVFNDKQQELEKKITWSRKNVQSSKQTTYINDL